MNSNYPYNPYSYNPNQYQQQYSRMQQNSREKRDLRRRSTLLACGIIIYVVVSTVMILLVLSTKELNRLFDDNSLFSNCVQIFISIISLLGAYFIVRLILDKNKQGFIPFGAPKNKKHALLLIPFGVCVCLAGSILTGYVDDFFEKEFDVVFTQPDFVDPTNALEAFVFLLSTALVPAFVEEIALRAGALQAMRKYGDWFAIVTSAFIFAVLHGNMVQTPFAFIAGLVLGYIFIATGSIWPGIIVHFINNFASSLVAMGTALGVSTQTLNILFGIHISVFAFAGVICFIIYLFDKQKPVLNKDTSTLSLPQKIGAFIINVPMILSLIYVCYITSRYIELK